MNILYVSHLSTNVASGPNWSVPASVNAQSKIDNVLWLNTTNVLMDHWRPVKAFYNIEEYGGLHLKLLPAPFDRPDVVVFEGFNFMEHVIFAKELNKNRVPYIIIPRGSLTYEALHNHSHLKKKIAHILFLNSFVKNARAIQYLTKGEEASSKRTFRTPSFVIPNGFDAPSVQKRDFSKNAISAIFVGRLDMYHKGIDLLLEAIRQLKTELETVNFMLSIHGPRRYDYYKIGEEIESFGIGSVACLKDEISGAEKENELMNSDLFVMTSRLEGHPMGLIEALSYGLPCLVSRGTNMLDEVRDSNAGWTCEVNIEDIKKALLQIIKEKDQLKGKGENAHSLSKLYQWDKLAVRFHEELKTIL